MTGFGITWYGPTGALKIQARRQSAIIPVVIGPPGLVGGGGAAPQIDVITGVVNGQTAFVLSRAPAAPASIRMQINGQQFRAPDFTITGVNVTWASLFTIQSTDEIEFTYPI